MHTLNTEIGEICFNPRVKFVHKTVDIFTESLAVPNGKDFYQVCK